MIWVSYTRKKDDGTVDVGSLTARFSYPPTLEQIEFIRNDLEKEGGKSIITGYFPLASSE